MNRLNRATVASCPRAVSVNGFPHPDREADIQTRDATPDAGMIAQDPPHPRRVLAYALLSLLCWSVPAPAAASDQLPIGTLADAAQASAFTPERVPGANDWNCVPTAAHPYPVVLVHGTMVNMGFTWAALAPRLKNAGYCVYALNYGHNAFSLGQRAGALTDIAASAGALKTFIDRVLAATKAPQVDIVGHSQGGLLPHYYIKRLGGAPQVHTFIGLAPSNHGTSVSGLLALVKKTSLINGFNWATAATTASVMQQETGSPFITALFADGDTIPGPNYVVIATAKDLIITPYTQSFLKGNAVRNITIQDQCPADDTGHIGLPFDGPTIQNLLNILGANDPHFKPDCRGYGNSV
ncbi:alpha/beta fold hydrolase [uncultured Thiodictyon sp.]|uniref:esterase/lipase family protein n=1 Tax=uncultured Thiodictyon sp. TaxID=1846217 RepID=UPI002600E5CB|nr:alpha/beta fold hydrolase [uncultured Thiodictyon sp.]